MTVAALTSAGILLCQKFPHIVRRSDISDGGNVVGHTYERDRKLFVLAAVDDAPGGKVECPFPVYAEARDGPMQLVVAVGEKFYKFDLGEIFGSDFRLSVREGKQVIQFDVRLGVNIERPAGPSQGETP